MRILRYVGPPRPSDADYRNVLDAADTAVVDTLPGSYNVTLTFKRDGAPVRVPMRDEIRDALDIAVTTYIADELVRRESSVDGWTRAFELVLPVTDVMRWSTAEAALRTALLSLSGDGFQFTWLPRGRLPAPPRRRRFLPSGYDVACLFSGGLDSLLGAYQLLSEGRKVLLVGHQAEGITAAAQTELARFLRQRFPNACSLIQCRVARSRIGRPRYALPEKLEESHRPRSFLFLVLALAVAQAARINEIVIAENGLIALNAPLQHSRLGTLSTRTAHPRYLNSLLDFFAAAGLFTGRLWNPFLFESKTDMLRHLPSELHGPALRSVSCSHAGRVPRRISGRTGVNHCGYCVPCLYRRLALMAAGIDDEKHYALDVFRDLASLTEHQQADFRALAGFARRVRDASPLERQTMVLAHGFFPANVGARIGPHSSYDYSPWTTMLERWAGEFLDVLERRSTAATLRVLGMRAASRRAAP